MNRYFDLYLTAGHSVPVVINANQYDSSETWIFTLYTEDGQLYTPASGSIVGLKSDGHTIANAGTVNNDGQVVIQETVQITAAKGINIFELVLNGNHGTANFVVLVEPRPGDIATPSDSDLSLMQEAIEAASTVGTVGTLADEVTNLKSQMEVWLTEHAGMSNETILWEGTLTGTGSVTLSEDASQFDTIAVYTQATSLYEADTASEAHFYKASDLIANHAVVSVAVASTVSNTAIDSAIITGIVGISGTQNKTFNLIGRKGLHWSGVATDGADIILGSSGSAIITKVVGIKNEQTDAEVVAARVGSDGTQYSNLKARLDAENSDLKSALSNIQLKDEIKQALLGLADAVGYKNDEIGDSARDALYHALYDVDVISITASFVQGTNIIYDDDSLDELKQYLTVTAYYDDGTHGEVTSYTLSGTLTVGTSTITVTYNGVSTTFNVTVSAGVPSGYTVYDYIQVANDKGSVVNNAVPASWITLKSYDNLDALSWNLKFSVLTGYTRFSAMIGARMDSAVTTGDAVYVGSQSSSSVGATDKARMIAHGNSSVYSSNAINLNAVNTLVFTNTAESPSKFAFNGVENDLPWNEELTVTRGLTLFTNPTPTATSMTLQRFYRIGALKLYDLSGNLVGDYLPCVRTSDARIGMFDRVTQTFFTSSTASYTTVGNSSCYYTVGNWS